MLFIEPHAGPAPIVHMIEAAKQSVDLNVYELTSHSIETALATAAQRGIRVRILLEGHPYGGGRIAETETAWCGKQAKSLTCKTAPTRFRFDHAKYLVVDSDDSEVGTANFTYSAFTRNREYLFTTRSPSIAQALEQVFHADWQGGRAGEYPRKALVLSPDSSGVMTALVRTPGPIDIESEEFGYIRSIVGALEAKGAAARIIVPKTISTWDRKTLSRLRARGVRIRFLSHPYLHAKLVLTPRMAFIGSENFSWTSLTRNREVGVLLDQAADLQILRTQFDQDWRASRGGS